MEEFKKLLFSDGTADYRIPSEPRENETVRIRFRAPKGAQASVFLVHEKERIPMHVAEQDGQFDYYETTILLHTERFGYCFEVTAGDVHCYYDRAGVTDSVRLDYAFCIVPGFSVPAWAKGAVMYQIFTERFYNGDPTNDVKDGEYYYIDRPTKHVANWHKMPENFDVANFYGGDLEGVRQKLDYLEKLGVEALYFNPLFVSASSHKYDTQDYDYIDPHFGVIVEDGGEPLPKGCADNTKADIYKSRVTNIKNLEASNELFCQLVKEAHARGMRVILDGVFNHCGSFNKWMNREKIYSNHEDYFPGAFESADSPYHSYFQFEDATAFPDNTTYEGWWGHNTLPKLNYEQSPALEQYILDIGKKWVSEPFCADGWRLDVAADLGHSTEYNHRFWKKFRNAVKEANPDAVILAEHYGDPKSWLGGDEWDTVMNYDAFMEPVSWFLTGMEKHSYEYHAHLLGDYEAYKKSMTHYMARFLTPSLQCAMNQLSNHDHSRFLTRTNHTVGRVAQLGSAAAAEGINKAVLKEAVVILMTWPGAPTLYYGDEVGLCGFTDPDNRRPYPWGKEDKQLFRFHRDMIRIHKENEALRTGSVTLLNGEKNLLCFGRFNRKQQFVVIVNNDAFLNTVEVPVCAAGIPAECTMQQVMYTGTETHSVAPVEYRVKDGVLSLTLPKYAAVVLKHES